MRSSIGVVAAIQRAPSATTISTPALA